MTIPHEPLYSDYGARTAAFCLLLALGAIAGEAFAGETGPGAVGARAGDTTLRIAYSDDGIHFVDSGRNLASAASAPTLVELENGDLLVLADVVPGGEGDRPLAHGATVMASTISKDQGQTWSALKPVMVLHDHRSAHNRDMQGHRPEVVRDGRGRVRLYFVDPLTSRNSQKSRGDRSTAMIRGATSRDGREFQLDGDTRIKCRRNAHPVIAERDDEVQLFTQERRKDGGWRTTRRSFEQGRDFRSHQVRMPKGVRFMGDALAIPLGYRAYVSSKKGIRSMVSREGSDWRLDEGVRIRGGWDPAMIRLRDGRYLAIYCAPLKLVAATADDAASRSRSLLGNHLPNGCLVAADQEDDFIRDVAELAALDKESTAYALNEGGETGADADSVAADAEGTIDAAEAVAASHKTGPPPDVDAGGYVALPDFETRFDYFDWFVQDMLGHPADNAYPTYASFMPFPGDEPGSKPDWPSFNDMFNGGTFEGPPGPWNPADNPTWEESHQAAAELVERFYEAGLQEGYAMTIDDAYKQRIAMPDGELMLIGLQLPSLGHHRRLARATMAAGWRMDNGAVPPEQMRDALAATIRGANHLGQGPTLIEELVSIAERELAYSNARWALKHGVFEGESLGEVFDTLRDVDRGNRDPRISTRGEHGMTMDTLQGTFWPKEPNGDPYLHEERLPRWTSTQEEHEQMLDEFRGLDRDDLRDAAQTFDTYYRDMGEMMSAGYPDIRSSDIDKFTEGFIGANPLTSKLIPHLGRVHKMRARIEASQRATQLAYATHLYRQESGSWPAALDVVADHYGGNMTTDPFTGENFGYRLTDDGPVIYSRSENGIDDGGVHSHRWDDSQDEYGSDDHIFWPPQSR
ncbi:MAG: sialidase family protein [Planctomycetota bacterium]|jgi:hypothetical protein